MVRNMRARGDLEYSKPPLTHEKLVSRLEQRGLHIASRPRALRYLQRIGYYRLSPYAIPYQVPDGNHCFRADVSFDDILALYIFDRELRLLVIDALERIEVAVRSAITDHMSITYSDAHWYTDETHFKNAYQHRKLLEMIQNTCEEQLFRRSENRVDSVTYPSALEHYLTTYGSPLLPPSWVVMEILTIGQLSRMYKNLQRRSDKTAVANQLGVTAPVMESWLETYVRVRNICAHHGRLWNVGLGVYPKIPESKRIMWLEKNLPERSIQRLYPVLVSLQTILYEISPSSSWSQRLYSLLASAPPVALAGIGVPQGWYADSFWQQSLKSH